MLIVLHQNLIHNRKTLTRKPVFHKREKNKDAFKNHDHLK